MLNTDHAGPVPAAYSTGSTAVQSTAMLNTDHASPVPAAQPNWQHCSYMCQRKAIQHDSFACCNMRRDCSCRVIDVPDCTQAERNRSQRKQQFVSRTIFHPSFKNVSMPEAIGFLGKEGETSRWLFRPSNKGTHQISITMKVCLPLPLHVAEADTVPLFC